MKKLILVFFALLWGFALMAQINPKLKPEIIRMANATEKFPHIVAAGSSVWMQSTPTVNYILKIDVGPPKNMTWVLESSDRYFQEINSNVAYLDTANAQTCHGNKGFFDVVNHYGNVAFGSGSSPNKVTIAASSGNTVIQGTLGVTGNVGIGTTAQNLFTITGASGNTAIAGTLGVTGAATTGDFQTGRAGVDGKLTVYSEQGATDYVTNILPATQTSDVTLYLPVDEPASTLPMTVTAGGVMGFGQSIATTATPTFSTLTLSDSIMTVKGCTHYLSALTLADDVSITLPAGKSGFGFIIGNNGATYANFVFTSAGAVTLLTDKTSDVAATDTDVKLAIFDAGTAVSIRNRLGSTLKFIMDIKFVTP